MPKGQKVSLNKKIRANRYVNESNEFTYTLDASNSSEYTKVNAAKSQMERE